MDSGQGGGGLLAGITVLRIMTSGLGPLSLCSTIHVPFLAKQAGIFGATQIETLSLCRD